MIQIDVLPGAREDMVSLRRKDPPALAAILAFLQEADKDQSLIHKCTTEGDVEIGGETVNVKPWITARRRNDNLFRFRLFEAPEATQYRMVYGFDWRQRRVGILAIVHRRDFDYELTGETQQRIIRDWRIATGGQNT
jgi:mRNA-degrading endonuclease RelE of RelBE toxin-antitoxin system